MENKYININLLKVHPYNKKIYGQEEELIYELVDKIKNSNYIKPIIVNKDNTIIDGHLRYYACIELEISQIPCEIIALDNELDILKKMLVENINKEKTTYQKMNEINMWNKIGEVKLDKILQYNNISNSTYMRARIPMIEIYKFENKNNLKDMLFLITVLNNSVNGAMSIVKLCSIEDIPYKYKEQIINGKITIQEGLYEIKQYIKSIKNKANDKPTTRICNKCGFEKSINEFYEGKLYCKDCHNNRSVNKRKAYKNVYGEEIKTDNSKLKGIDLDAIERDVKNTNKNINNIDYNATVSEFKTNTQVFINNINKYINFNDIYKLSNIDKINKNEMILCISNVEEILNQIKNILI